MTRGHHSLDMVEHAEHFEDFEKQAHAARLGMWVFLGSETLLFAGLFGLYTAYRIQYAAAFQQAFHHNNVAIGTANTVILITSSFCIAWALHAIRESHRRTAALMLAATSLLGITFLVLKGIEYAQHFHEGIYPGVYYRSTALPAEGAKMFFTLYYFMTGLHAIHVIAGLVAVMVLLVLTLRRRFTVERHTALELGGLYWHLVDVVWIFLWPLFYLVG